jgi:hypothetical protein
MPDIEPIGTATFELHVTLVLNSMFKDKLKPITPNVNKMKATNTSKTCTQKRPLPVLLVIGIVSKWV